MPARPVVGRAARIVVEVKPAWLNASTLASLQNAATFGAPAGGGGEKSTVPGTVPGVRSSRSQYEIVMGSQAEPLSPNTLVNGGIAGGVSEST